MKNYASQTQQNLWIEIKKKKNNFCKLQENLERFLDSRGFWRESTQTFQFEVFDRFRIVKSVQHARLAFHFRECWTRFDCPRPVNSYLSFTFLEAKLTHDFRNAFGQRWWCQTHRLAHLNSVSKCIFHSVFRFSLSTISIWMSLLIIDLLVVFGRQAKLISVIW